MIAPANQPVPRRPINAAVARVAGVDMQPIISSIRVSNDALEEIYQRLVKECLESNMSSPEARQIAALLPPFCMILSRLSQVTHLMALAQFLKEVGIVPAVVPSPRPPRSARPAPDGICDVAAHIEIKPTLTEGKGGGS